MKTLDEIKSEFRIVEINDNFYIQKKTIVGWSYDTMDASKSDSPNWPAICIIGCAFLLLATIVTGIFCLCGSKSLPFFILLSIFILFSVSTILAMNKSKSLAIKKWSLSSATTEIINEANHELLRLQKIANDEELKKLNKIKKTSSKKTYHYFYTDRQLRSKKLKQLDKKRKWFGFIKTY